MTGSAARFRTQLRSVKSWKNAERQGDERVSERRDVVVVGAGVHGLCAAFALRRRGLRVLVVDRFEAGHDYGGSHGAGRITRSSYHDRRYVEMTRRMHREAWPTLESELGVRLVHPTPGLFYGPERGPFAAFLDATLAAGVDVEELPRAEAAARFPMLRFDPGDRVMLDHTAGVLAADRTLASLRAWLTANDVELRHGVRVTSVARRRDAVTLAATCGDLQAAHVVLATGAWLGELLPAWRTRLTPLRQEVGYVDVDAAPADLAAGRFPVWCRVGGPDDAFDYGLPVFDRPGLKVAQHRTHGAPDDVEDAGAPVDEAALLARARRRLTLPVRGLHGVETCLYAVAENERLHVTTHPDDPRVVAVAACSGHGFKFGPVLAEQVADLVQRNDGSRR